MPSDEPKMPVAESSGFVKTLNSMGYMTSKLDWCSQQFVSFSPTVPGPALDVGAAYGVATIAALEAGAKVIANDIDARHLQILMERAPANLRQNLLLKPGDFPNVDIQPSSLGAALVARVFHFFPGEMIELSAHRLFNWLMRSGKVFVVAET